MFDDDEGNAAPEGAQPNPALDALAGKASELESMATQEDAPAEPAPSLVSSTAKEVSALLMVCGSMLSMRWPSCAKVYTEQNCDLHGAAIAPALVRLGWTGGVMADYIGAGVALVGLAVATREAIRADSAKPVNEDVPQ